VLKKQKLHRSDHHNLQSYMEFMVRIENWDIKLTTVGWGR
jgi:hypothetical protein